VKHQGHVGDTFGCEGPDHRKFVRPGQTALLPTGFATSEGQVDGNCPERWWKQDWLIHYDKAVAQTVLLLQQFLVAKIMAVVSSLLIPLI
jgi:hypothetical protein